MPTDFIESIKSNFPNESDVFLKSIDTPVSASIRSNPQKAVSMVGEQIPWTQNSYYLKERPKYIEDPHFHAGCYYPQESSSMILEEVIRQIHLPENPIVLDLCAAPGGKSTHLLQLLNHSGFLIANEVIGSRAQILKENIIKWGYSNVMVSNNDPQDFERLKLKFDAILIDAPCSGEGLFRKDASASEHWSLENVQLCQARQKRILANTINSLNENGYLIYSTCTYNKFENEAIVQWLLQEFKLTYIPLVINQFNEIFDTSFGYKFLPHLSKGAGFFIAVLQKKSNDFRKENTLPKIKSQAFRKLKNVDTSVTQWVKKDDDTSFFQKDDEIYLFREINLPVIELAHQTLQIIYTGLPVALQTKKGFNPTHELAMSAQFNSSQFPSIEVDWQNAIRYLRRDQIKAPAQHPGWHFITYQKKILGWVKNIGNRLNNNYPKHWRIRKNITELD